MKTVHDKVLEGNKEAILHCFKQKDPCFKVLAVVIIVNKKILDEEIINCLKEIKSLDNEYVRTYSVSVFASAALDILDIEKYKGDDEIVKEFIKERMNFLTDRK